MLAILFANSITSVDRFSLGKWSFINEILFASAESIVSPVNSIFIASFFLTFLDKATIGVEQNKPKLTPGVANDDESEATAKSQLATN